MEVNTPVLTWVNRGTEIRRERKGRSMGRVITRWLGRLNRLGCGRVGRDERRDHVAVSGTRAYQDVRQYHKARLSQIREQVVLVAGKNSGCKQQARVSSRSMASPGESE